MTKNKCKDCNYKRSKEALEDDIEWLLEDIKKLIECAMKIKEYRCDYLHPSEANRLTNINLLVLERIQKKTIEYVELEGKIKEME